MPTRFSFRRLGWLLLIAAVLAARAIAPEGWMPVASAAGIEITVCNGQEPGTAMVLAPDGTLKHKTPVKGQPGDHACAFAGVSVADASPIPTLTLPPRAAANMARLPVRLTAPGRGLAAPPPPATGPPTRA